MNILICGMLQSGSTLVYNIIRGILKQKSKDFYGCFYTDFVESESKKYNIIKCHAFEQHLLNFSDVVILTHRDLRDCFASRVRRWGDSDRWSSRDAKMYCLENLQSFYEWKDSADFIVKYETYYNNLNELILILSSLIKINNVDVADVINYIESLKNDVHIPEQVDERDRPYEKETLLTKSHITNNGKINDYQNVLNDDEINAINNCCKKYLQDYSYLV